MFYSRSTSFDFNADGKNEVVYNDETHLRIYEGATGRVLYEIANSSHTLFEYPVIADVNGDGHANIIVGGNNYSAWGTPESEGIRIFSAPQNNWVGTREIWSSHSYVATQISSGGSLTAGLNKDIRDLGGISVHLVGFRNNIPYNHRLKSECR